MPDSWIANVPARVWAWVRSLPARVVAWLLDWGRRAITLIVSSGLFIISLALRVAAVFRWLFSKTVLWYAQKALIAAALIVVVGAAGMFALVHYPSTRIPEYEPVDEVVFLDQGWGEGRDSKPRQTYYYTPQGTTLLFPVRYSWFVHLEMPWGRDRFADPDHLRRYGFIVDPAGESNPDQLPLGFTKHYDAELADDLLDISCATCHSGQINRTLEGGKRIGIRIDGGQAMHAFAALEPPHFMPVLLASMTSTYFNPWKFDRFAKKVLGESAPEAKDVLAEQIWEVLTAFLREGWNEQTKHCIRSKKVLGELTPSAESPTGPSAIASKRPITGLEMLRSATRRFGRSGSLTGCNTRPRYRNRWRGTWAKVWASGRATSSSTTMGDRSGRKSALGPQPFRRSST